jgi:flagellar FliJ protein
MLGGIYGRLRGKEMFRFNLQAVLNHRQFIEESLQKAYAHLKGMLSREQDVLANFEKQQTRLIDELSQKQSQDTTSSELLLYVTFLDRLKADLKKQQQKIAALEQEATQKRNELLEAMKNRKAMEKLKEKKLAEHMEDIAKKEQAFLDEIGINRFSQEPS